MTLTCNQYICFFVFNISPFLNPSVSIHCIISQEANRIFFSTGCEKKIYQVNLYNWNEYWTFSKLCRTTPMLPIVACRYNYSAEDSSSIHSFGKKANPANYVGRRNSTANWQRTTTLYITNYNPAVYNMIGVWKHNMISSQTGLISH